MNPLQQIQHQISDSIATKQALLSTCTKEILTITDICTSKLKQGKKLLFCGNGGSAGDAQHIAAEFIVRLRSSFERPPIAAMALTTDSSILTASGNDYGFETIFSRQVAALGKEDDILIGLSTSGNSANVVEAFKVAKEKKLICILFSGESGGKLLSLSDYALLVPSTVTERIQECHLLVGHIMTTLIEESLYS